MLYEGSFNGVAIPETEPRPIKSETVKYGINNYERWWEKTEGEASEKPGNFLRFQERTKTLITTALSVIEDKTPQEHNKIRDWFNYKHNKDKYWQELHTQFENISDLTVLDVGAGLGSLYSTLDKANIKPAEYIAIEPTHTNALKQRFPEINVVNAKVGINSLPEEVQTDIAILSGIAPYYKWEGENNGIGFKDILTDIEKHVKPGGVIVFSFTLDTLNPLDISKLPASLRQMYEEAHAGYKKYKPRYTKQQLEDLGYTVGPEIFIGNYVAYKKVGEKKMDDLA